MNGLTYTKGWNEDRKLLMKMSKIMGEVGAIPKTGFNKFHQYYYHSEADINKAFQVLFSEHNMVLIPSLESSEMRTTTTRNEKIEYIQKSRMVFTIMDAETGESLCSYMEGEGQDVGDKALYKSISGTQKYFLMKTFMIQDQNDPEADESVDERNSDKHSAPPKTQEQQQRTNTPPPPHIPSNVELATPNQVKMLGAKAKAAQISVQRVPDILGYEVNKFDDVRRSDVNKLIKILDDTKAEIDSQLNHGQDNLPF